MATGELIPLADRARWEAALVGTPHRPAHTWWYRRAMQLTAPAPVVLLSFEHAGARVVCPLALRPAGDTVDVATPYGLSGFAATEPCPDFAGWWRSLGREQGWVSGYVAVPDGAAGPLGFDADECSREKTLFGLDLSLTESELRGRLSRNRRRQLRGWHAGAGHLESDREVVAAFVEREYPAFVARRAMGPALRFSGATLADLARHPEVLAIGARDADGLAAAMLITTAGVHADLLLNVSRPGGERHSTELVWTAAMALKARGTRWLDLGGGARDGDSLAEFKLRFGGLAAPFWSLRHVFDQARYDRLLGARAGTGGYFPAYRAASRPGAR